MSLQVLCPFFNQIAWFFGVDLYRFFCYILFVLDSNPLAVISFANYRLPFTKLLFHLVNVLVCTEAFSSRIKGAGS